MNTTTRLALLKSQRRIRNVKAKMQNSRFPSNWTTISILFLILVYFLDLFAQPPPADTLKPKIFVLGLSKTGTTSIGDAFERLGYRRLGWRDIRSRHLVHTFVNGDFEPLLELTKYYDAFEDLPWPLLYREMAQLYPDSKFILSLRKDSETWLQSMRTHMDRGKWQPYTAFYGAETMQGNEEIILQSYLNHTANVRDFFKDAPHRYIELNIDDGDMNWNKTCLIAQCPGGQIPSIGFPRSNSVASWDMGFGLKNLHWFWGWAVTKVEERTTRWYYVNAGGWKSPLGLGWRVYDFVDRVGSEIYFRFWAPAFSRL